MWRKEYSRYRKYFSDIVSVYQQKEQLRTYLEILLSLTTIVVFVLLALRPTFLTISQLLREIREKEDLVAQMDEKIANVQIAQNLASQEAVTISLLTTAVPDGPLPETFIRQLEGIAKQRGVQVLGFAAGEAVLSGEGKKATKRESEEELPAGAEGTTISVSITGDYLALSNFLSDLENLRRPFLIDSLSINQGEETIVLVASGRAAFQKGEVAQE